MEEITTEQRLERIRKLLEPQEPTAVHIHLPDSCSRRLGIVAVLTEGRVPLIRGAHPLNLIKNTGNTLGSWSPSVFLLTFLPFDGESAEPGFHMATGVKSLVSPLLVSQDDELSCAVVAERKLSIPQRKNYICQ